MEDLDSNQVADWVAAQNKVTFDYLAKLPLREHFGKRITELWDYPKVSIPVREGGRYFYSKNSGLQRQSPVYMRPSLTEPTTLVLDPNQLSPDGSVSLSQWEPSHDGKQLAYGLSEGGADWRNPARARPRLRQGSVGRNSLGALLRHLLDQRQQGILLLPLSGAAEGQSAGSGFVRTRRFTTIESERRKPRTA